MIEYEVSPFLGYRIMRCADSDDARENGSGFTEHLEWVKAPDFPGNSCQECTRTSWKTAGKPGLHGFDRMCCSLAGLGQEALCTLLEERLSGPAAQALRIVVWSLK